VEAIEIVEMLSIVLKQRDNLTSRWKGGERKGIGVSCRLVPTNPTIVGWCL
jgi:hypothetical protein